MAFGHPPARAQAVPSQREHSAQTWERQRKNIERLYLEDNVHLEDLPAAMLKKFGFDANRRQYITRIRRWGLHKNLKDSELRIIYRKLLQREAIGKQTRFTVNGREVQLEHILKCVKRKRIPSDISLLPKDATPYHIIGFTPKSMPNAHPIVLSTATPYPPVHGLEDYLGQALQDELDCFRESVVQLVDHVFASELELRILLLLEICEESRHIQIATDSFSTHPGAATQVENRYDMLASFLDVLASDFRGSCKKCSVLGHTTDHESHIDAAALDSMRRDIQYRLRQSGLDAWDPCFTDCQSNRTLLNPRNLLLCPNHFRRVYAEMSGAPNAPAEHDELDIACTLSTSLHEPATLMLLQDHQQTDAYADWLHLGADDITLVDAVAEPTIDEPQVFLPDIDPKEWGESSTMPWITDFPDFLDDTGYASQVLPEISHRQCSMCGISCDSPHEIDKHIAEVHQKDLLPFDHLCFACGSRFQTIGQLDAHCEENHPNGVELSPPLITLPQYEGDHEQNLIPVRKEDPWSSRLWGNMKNWTQGWASAKSDSTRSRNDSTVGSLTFSDVTMTTEEDENKPIHGKDNEAFKSAVLIIRQHGRDMSKDNTRLSRTMPIRMKASPRTNPNAYSLPAGM